jgi:signal transduction histidine kinase
MYELEETYWQQPEHWARFFSAFIHEIRTPIASLGILAELMAESAAASGRNETTRYAERIGDVVQDIQAMTVEVSELSRLITGRTPAPEATTVELAQIARRVEEAGLPRAAERNVALALTSLAASPRAMHLDAGRLIQAVTLLVGVAIGQARTEARCLIELDADMLRVEISSDGVPIPDAVLPSYFAPFEDGGHSPRAKGGQSLALPLARELVRFLGGTMTAANPEGRPTFILGVPAGTP